MSASDWLALRRLEETRLLGLLERPSQPDVPPALSAIATLLVFVRHDIDVVLVENRARPVLRVDVGTGSDSLASGLIAGIECALWDGLTDRQRRFNPAAWVRDHDLDGFVVDLLAASDGRDVARDLMQDAAEAARACTVLCQRFQQEYLAALQARDLPDQQQTGNWRGLPPLLVWMLAPDRDGDVDRQVAVDRRRQAAGLFAALGDTLRMPGITASVDNGESLVPALSGALGLPARAIRAVRGIQSSGEAWSVRSAEDVLKALCLHEVPFADWPGGAVPDRPAAWATSPWLGAGVPGYRRALALFRWDVLAHQSTFDVLGALCLDLLRPLIVDRLSRHPRPTMVMHGLARLDVGGEGLQLYGAPADLDVAGLQRDLLRAVRSAVIGSRGSAAVREAADLWHRRAAAVAALRNEVQQARPGWPALCQPWLDADSGMEIVPLTTAQALVEEGSLLEHCVGGYYETCRRGDTQILSLRQDGQRLATIEIQLGADLHRPTLTVGQFEGLRRCRPAAAQHEALRAFLRVLRTGAHPMQLRAIAGFRERRRTEYDAGWGQALPLAHARQAYGLHRVLLPRGAPDDFDSWVATSGLGVAIDHLLSSLAGVEAQSHSAAA